MFYQIYLPQNSPANPALLEIPFLVALAYSYVVYPADEAE